MNDGISSHESNESDDFSSSSDEIRVNSQQIQQTENNFDDIDDFWSNTKATPRLTSVSIGNSENSPRITFPTRSPNNQILYQPTPPRFSQNSINKFSNSPIYVGTSTEDTPYRYNSKGASVSSDYSGNEDSSSSDDITFVDTPITDKSKSKPKPPAFSNPKEIFKLSPITSNKNESNKENDSSENNYIDSSSSESEISVSHSNSKESNEQNNLNLNSPSDNKIVNEPNNDSNFPLPPFSFLNSSDSESSKDQNNDTHISQTRNNKVKDFNVNSSKKDSNKKNKSNSKPAFASPKRISSGLKEETIITELSPFASSRRNRIESKRMPNFRLSQIDDDDDVEKINQQENIKESFSYHKEEDNEKSDNGNSTNVQNSFQIDDNEDNQKEFSDDNDSDDIKKIEKLAKKDPLHKKKMDDLITDYNLSKKERYKSPSKKEIKSNDETELKPKAEPKTRETKSNSESKNHQQKSNSEPKSKNKSKSKSEKDTENENKLNKNQSKSKQKQKSSVQSNSQPPKTKQKSKADSKSKSPTKSSSQPSKPRVKKEAKLHYDFNNLSDDSDEERISNLIQIPDQKEEKSNKDDSTVNDNDDDLPIALRRRKRVIVKPLKFWCGEHIVYGLSEDGFQTFQNVSIPEKLKKLKKGENRVMPKDQKRIPAKDDCERKLTRVEGSGLVLFKEKVVDFDKSNEVILKKKEKCNVACKGDSPLIFKIEEI